MSEGKIDDDHQWMNGHLLKPFSTTDGLCYCSYAMALFNRLAWALCREEGDGSVAKTLGHGARSGSRHVDACRSCRADPSRRPTAFALCVPSCHPSRTAWISDAPQFQASRMRAHSSELPSQLHECASVRSTTSRQVAGESLCVSTSRVQILPFSNIKHQDDCGLLDACHVTHSYRRHLYRSAATSVTLPTHRSDDPSIR